MPFKTILAAKKQEIFITDYENPKIELLGESFKCPYCGEKMLIRHGKVRRAHFYHAEVCRAIVDYKPGQAGGGESDEHRAVKRAVLERLVNLNNTPDKIEFKFEVHVKDNGVFQIADVGKLLKATGQMLTAYEIQLSPINLDSLKARTDAYLHFDIDTIWILGGKALTPETKEWCLRNIGQVWEVEIIANASDISDKFTA